MLDLVDMGKRAKAASRLIASLSTEKKNAALETIAAEIESATPQILAANALDVAAAREKGLTDAFVDRLLLTESRIAGLARDTRKVASLPDPVGSELESRVLPNGLRLSRRRIPLGVIGVIYEARPNVTIDIAVLSLKTGNAAILRGGSNTLRTNVVLTQVIQTALAKVGMPADAVQYISDTDRAYVAQLLRLDESVDMIIPRGGHKLHLLCKNESSVPVITGGIGICHAFVDESADFTAAIDIIENSKIQKPSACNALDTILVHQNIAGAFLPQVAARLAQSKVEIHAHDAAYGMLSGNGHGATITQGQPADFDQEWLGMIVNAKIVTGVDEAVEHIQAHSMEHSDCILTNDWKNATRFVDHVNSCAVFVNASTRFNDGGQFGLGAEVAISTQKLHARGPMGLEELTTYKWICIGEGHVRP